MGGLLTIAPTIQAKADTLYDFSYKFNSGDVVTGSFMGNPNGNLITNLTDISVSLDGVTFNGNGSLSAFAWSYDGFNFGPYFTGAVASFNGLQNNFYFVDTTSPRTSVGTNYFLSETTPITFCISSNHGGCISNNPTNFVAATFVGGKSVSDGIGNSLPNNSWTVTAVPEAGEWAMMLLGLPLLGWVVRRKQTAMQIASA